MNRDAEDPEEVAALAVLDALGRTQGPDETHVPEPEDEVEEVLRRLHTEAVGRLPYALPLAAPDPEIRRQLLRQVRADETQEVEPVEPVAAPAPSEAATAKRAPAPPSLPPDVVPLPAPDPIASLRYAGARRSRRRWLVPLAAAAAVLAIAGLGLWGAWLQSELAATRSRLAWAEREWKGELETARQRLAQLESRYDLVTAPAVTVFPLVPPDPRGPAAGATARLYVAPDHQHWTLEVSNLHPEPAGRDYQIWFLTATGSQSGACFNMQEGRPVFKMVSGMPHGMQGVAVSIEPKGGSPYPTSPMVLVNQQPVRL